MAGVFAVNVSSKQEKRIADIQRFLQQSSAERAELILALNGRHSLIPTHCLELAESKCRGGNKRDRALH